MLTLNSCSAATTPFTTYHSTSTLNKVEKVNGAAAVNWVHYEVKKYRKEKFKGENTELISMNNLGSSL